MENLIEYYCSLNVKKFSKMLDNTTQCYKFFWLDSIMQLVARGEETPTFLEIFAGMIADAWYAVSEYHLRLGPKKFRYFRTGCQQVGTDCGYQK